jgi:uncharacterized protein (TIGR02246 family)
MRRTLALAVLLSAFTLSAAAQAPTDSRRHPVETFFTSGITAFNAHDLEGFMKQFAPDVEMYTPAGWLRGQAPVRERFAQTFKQFPSVRMVVEDLRVREVAPGTAVTDFTWRVYPLGQGPAFHGVGSGVYVLREGKWAEVLEHETVVKVDEGLAPKK